MATYEEIIAAGGTVPGGAPTETATPDFTKVLQDRLLQSADMISSANTGLESAIQGAIGKVESSTEKGSQVIESKYGREIGALKTGLEGQLTAARERGVGINTSDIAYKSMAAEADKQIKDLEQRKNELILQNDAAGAAKVSDLMIQTLSMKNQAMQQTFSNLLSMSQFGLQAKQEERASRAQTFAEQQAEASIGLQYGISKRPNESWDSFISRASVNADKKQTLELAKLSSEIKTSEANRRRIEAEAARGESVSDLRTAEEWYSSDPGNFTTLFQKDTKSIERARPGAIKLQNDRYSEQVYNRVLGGENPDTILKEFTSGQVELISDYETMKAVTAAIDKAVQDKPKNQGLFGAAKETLAGIKIKQSERKKGQETKPLMGEYFQGSPINEFKGYFQ